MAKPNWRSMYFSLMGDVESAIRILTEAQQKCEEMYLAAGDEAHPPQRRRRIPPRQMRRRRGAPRRRSDRPRQGPGGRKTNPGGDTR